MQIYLGYVWAVQLYVLRRHDDGECSTNLHLFRYYLKKIFRHDISFRNMFKSMQVHVAFIY